MNFLVRIIATLMSLAALADRLARAPRPLRRLVLWILRPAETAARDLVFREACACGARMLLAELFETGRGWGVAEAARMAASFRAMAWALQHMNGRFGLCSSRLRSGKFANTMMRVVRRLRSAAETAATGLTNGQIAANNARTDARIWLDSS